MIAVDGPVHLLLLPQYFIFRKDNMATIYDIAQAAGVAKSTVANALSGKGSVSEATRQRILQVAQEMGYRPNTVARSLFLRKTFTIGLVLPAISNPFYPEVAEAVEKIASEYEYQTLLCNTHENHPLGRQHMERLISRWVDGYIILDRSLSVTDIEQYFQQGHPIVLFDWQEQQAPQKIPRVCGDISVLAS
jgi:LacI family transcriptional regulator